MSRSITSPRLTTPVWPLFDSAVHHLCPAQEPVIPDTILVTGATGTIGRERVRQLKADGAYVIARSSSGKTIEGVDMLFLPLPLLAGCHCSRAGTD